jgi:hypothetical protein
MSESEGGNSRGRCVHRRRAAPLVVVVTVVIGDDARRADARPDADMTSWLRFFRFRRTTPVRVLPPRRSARGLFAVLGPLGFPARLLLHVVPLHLALAFVSRRRRRRRLPRPRRPTRRRHHHPRNPRSGAAPCRFPARARASPASPQPTHACPVLSINHQHALRLRAHSHVVVPRLRHAARGATTRDVHGQRGVAEPRARVAPARTEAQTRARRRRGRRV